MSIIHKVVFLNKIILSYKKKSSKILFIYKFLNNNNNNNKQLKQYNALQSPDSWRQKSTTCQNNYNITTILMIINPSKDHWYPMISIQTLNFHDK